MDYGYLGRELEATPLFYANDQKHRWFYGLALPSKGVGEWPCAAVCEMLRLAGHARMVLRSDSEPAMKNFKLELLMRLTKEHGQEIVPEDALIGSTSSAGNGLAEHAVRELKAKDLHHEERSGPFLGLQGSCRFTSSFLAPGLRRDDHQRQAQGARWQDCLGDASRSPVQPEFSSIR